MASLLEYGQGEGEVLGKVTSGKGDVKVVWNLLDRSEVKGEPADNWANV